MAKKILLSLLVLTLCLGGVLLLRMSSHTKQMPTARDEPNRIVSFMRDVEIQTETDSQFRGLCQGLADLASLPYTELQQRRYASYDQTPNQWDIVTLLKKHMVPATPSSLTAEDLAMDVEKPASRAAVRQVIVKWKCNELTSP